MEEEHPMTNFIICCIENVKFSIAQTNIMAMKTAYIAVNIPHKISLSSLSLIVISLHFRMKSDMICFWAAYLHFRLSIIHGCIGIIVVRERYLL